jgi:hypothetical protein
MSAGVELGGGEAENGTTRQRPGPDPCRRLCERGDMTTARRVFRISGGTRAIS